MQIGTMVTRKIFLLIASLGVSTLALAQNAQHSEEPAEFARGVLKIRIVGSSTATHAGFSAQSAELEITPDQKEALRAIVRDYMRKSRFFVGDLNKIQFDASEGKATDKDIATAQNAYNEKMSELVQVILKEIEEILLPHQIVRLDQLAYQTELVMANDDQTPFLLSKVLQDLEMENSERVRIVSDLEELKKRYKMELDELNAKFEKLISDRLPDEVEKKIKEKVGRLVVR